MANTKKKKYYPWEFWATPKFIQIDGRLTQTDKTVLSILITRMNGDNELIVKQKTISEDSGIPIRSIKCSVAKLKKLGLMDIKRLNMNLCNRYKINV